jgi:Ni/Co efflux regulator RcnB
MKKIRKQKPTRIIDPTIFPSGLAVSTEKNIYWIKDFKRYRLISKRAAESWMFTTVMATETAVSGMKLAGKLGFRDGTLIKNIADGKMYLISQNKRRHLVDPDSFAKYGLDRNSVVEVSESETAAHELGDSL